MTDRHLRLGGASIGVGGSGQHDTWLDPEIPGDANVNIGWYIELTCRLEAARFDVVFIVDSQSITAASRPHHLNRLEPLALRSALAVSTSSIGLVGTITTSSNEPFNVARRHRQLDLVSGGRAGWNVVASGDAGLDSRDEHHDDATATGAPTSTSASSAASGTPTRTTPPATRRPGSPSTARASTR